MLAQYSQNVNLINLEYVCIFYVFFAKTKYMKRILSIFLPIFTCFLLIFTPNCAFCKETSHARFQPRISIVIDDFGGYEQAGVAQLLSVSEPLTCAVIPLVDNTKQNLEQLSKTNHEIILHMPMQAHVNLPKDWYGETYIAVGDSQDTINSKFEKCLNDFPNIKGFNMHIGSGVSRHKETMKNIYNFAKQNNLYFLDSRTIETNAVVDAAKETNSIYLGRDEFLEADKNKSYANAKFRLLEGAKKAIQTGSSIVIGHVGAEGGEQTAKAIIDTLPEIKKMGVEIVPLSSLYELAKIHHQN